MSALRRLGVQRATIGLRGMAAVAWRHRLHRALRAYEICRPLVAECRGLEIGGPSAIFARGGDLPLYPLFAQLDNCDFAGRTIWHGETKEVEPYRYDVERPPGRRYVREAISLDGIDDGSYDVLLGSHVLEHIANPLRALHEWKRVVGPEGLLVLVVPHLQNTFDHERAVTRLEHLEEDFANETGEDDATHVPEFIERCDLARVPERLTREDFERRTRDHAANRTLHHHVFDTDLVVRLVDRARCELLWVETALPFHIVAVARARAGDNGRFTSPTASWRRTSVFRRDRS